MKKVLIATLVLALMMTLCVNVVAFPASKIVIDVPYGSPALDGNINPADYSAKLTLTEDISHVWAGEYSGPVDFYFAWNENGLVVAFDTNNLPLKVKNESRTTHGDNADRPQISINPGNLFDIDEVPENNGFFYTFTVGTDDKVVVTRDNVAGNALGFGIDGKDDGEIPVTGGFADKGNGWSAEYLIPWGEIDINGMNFTAAPGVKSDFNIYYCCEEGCWGTRLESSESPWGLADNAFTMNFLAKVEAPIPEPDPEPAAVVAAEVAPAAPAVAPAVKTGDAGMIILAAVMIAAAIGVVVFRRKNVVK